MRKFAYCNWNRNLGFNLISTKSYFGGNIGKNPTNFIGSENIYWILVEGRITVKLSSLINFAESRCKQHNFITDYKVDSCELLLVGQLQLHIRPI